jgi:hypothetical protein
MGGDTPLDWEGELYGACGLSFDDYFENMTKDEVSAVVKANVPKMIACLNEDSWYPGVPAQVLGVLMMRHGCDPKDAFVKKALEIARAGAENDDWDDDERRGFIAAYIKQLDEYDGTPQEPKSEGLLEKVFEAMAEGKEGLVNKQYT